MFVKGGSSKISAKDAWSSNLFDRLDKLNQNKTKTQNRSDMIHKINILDETLNVYGVRLENVINLADKLVERIINVRKKRNKQNITVNTIAKAEDLLLETRPRIFYDDTLKRWNGKGDTILRNITINYEGKILFEREKDSYERLLFNNIELSQEIIDKFKGINFKGLHICPSLVESQTESVFEDDFFDDNLEMNLNEDHFIDNFADQFNDFGLEDQQMENKNVKQEIKFENLEPTPFTYHKAWAGPSHWKFSSIKKRLKNKKKNKKKRFDFFEFFNKNEILNDKRSTLFKEEEILERRKKSKNLKKDFGFRVEDLYTYCLITNMDCFIEKKEKISDSNIIDHENPNSLLNNQADMSFNKNDMDLCINHNILNNKNADISSGYIDLPEIFSLRHPKSQRRMNMKDLQSKINEIIENCRKSNLGSGISFKTIFDSLNKEITWQYMVVAILEMANSGLRISEENCENVVY